ncbi:TniQ family protein [Streptomyces sp. RPA4-5]|uniref:TniQ family protein n=1 Tax=Streptomyces sp. RPA4-5 TaxID=2721245 RepID=UPI002494E40F|nr:TniQ family protein [Streptomyces sp. RPA4-5]
MTALRGSQTTGRWPCSTSLRGSLPQQVQFVAAESTGSYVQRLASANGLEPIAVLDLIGRGQRALPEPGSAELYLNAAALSRLSMLVGCSAAQLQRALPTLRAPHLLITRNTAPAWRWCPCELSQEYLLRGCRLCAASKGTHQAVYVWSGTPWQVCVRHGRWLDNVPEEEAAWLPPPDAVARVVKAHQRRLLFERRLGPMGRVLFADAYSACAYWWNQPRLTLPVWRERQQAFSHVDYSDPFPALLVIYPEVVRLAQMFAQRERLRLRCLLDAGAWERQMRKLFRAWGTPFEIDEVRRPIDVWMGRHRDPEFQRPLTCWPPRTASPRALAGSDRRVPLCAPHTKADASRPLEDLTCLPFNYGRGVVSVPQDSRTDILHLRPFYDATEGVGWEMLPQPSAGAKFALDPRRLV